MMKLIVELCKRMQMPDEQLRQVFDQLKKQTDAQRLAYLKQLKHAYTQWQARKQAYEAEQRQQQEEQRRQQQEIAEAEAERKEMAEDGVVRAEDGADDEDVADVLEMETMGHEDTQSKELVFSVYEPKKVSYGRRHPEPIVESSAMASVDPPDVTYVPSLPRSLLRGERGIPRIINGQQWLGHAESALSAAQLESVTYAGQRHAMHNQDSTRCGFFIGDGTGVGKGREISGVILDNYSAGRRRHVWVSISTALYYDCQRDLADLGRANVPVYPLHKLPYGELPPEVADGVMFCTYQSLIARNKSNESRLDQIVTWCAAATDADDADAFDGCVVFDEAHRAKNLVPQTEKTQGRSTGSKTAEAVTALQAHLPNGRVLYVSATAAAETKDLGYMTRLGLWGRGCTFPDFSSFATGIARAGVGAMELVAMDMKARGLFVSRMLSFSGCSFEKHECALSRAERELYDQAAAWWEELHAAFEECMQLTSSEGAARSFWSSHQSFFKQLLNSIKCRFAISEAQAALDRGECVVVGLLSTGEAKANEAVEREKRDGKEIESEVSTPHEIARDLLERHLPVVHHDSGLVVPAARTIKDGLLAKLEAIKMPGNALDLIISHFGVEQVAEMTGRKMRIITANGRTEVQQRAPPGESQDRVNISEKEAFLNGHKKVAVISEAASSGISLHADSRFANQARRFHITLELAWSADKMLQQFGRTHRSNQVCPPHYVLLVTDVGGEQRFASSVARRLELLGAMTRGDRRGGHGAAADLVQFNLDTPLGHSALAVLMDSVGEKAEEERLWDKALSMLKCYKDGVPSLLGLCVINVAQHGLHPPKLTASKAKDKEAAEAAARKAAPHDIGTLPEGLQEYIRKLRAWAKPKIEGVSMRRRTAEKAQYGVCPKAPHKHGLTWNGCASAMQRMKLLNQSNMPVNEGDRYNINKFLNRLLGLNVETQNALFAFYNMIFRWVVISAKAQGRVDSGVGIIQGESVKRSAAAEVIYCDPSSSAITEVHAITVDSGLAFPSAHRLLQAALAEPSVKSTLYGGTTGFWRQNRSGRLVLAIEMPATSADRSQRLHRILRPTAHPSSKPQFVPAPELKKRYTCVREEAGAQAEWEKAYEEAEPKRLKEVVLLTGSILPVWTPLTSALGSARRGKEASLPVKKW